MNLAGNSMATPSNEWLWRHSEFGDIRWVSMKFFNNRLIDYVRGTRKKYKYIFFLFVENYFGQFFSLFLWFLDGFGIWPWRTLWRRCIVLSTDEMVKANEQCRIITSATKWFWHEISADPKHVQFMCAGFMWMCQWAKILRRKEMPLNASFHRSHLLLFAQIK